MPQLDGATYLSQVVWVSGSFRAYYRRAVTFIVPSLYTVLATRSRRQARSATVVGEYPERIEGLYEYYGARLRSTEALAGQVREATVVQEDCVCEAKVVQGVAGAKGGARGARDWKAQYEEVNRSLLAKSLIAGDLIIEDEAEVR